MRGYRGEVCGCRRQVRRNRSDGQMCRQRCQMRGNRCEMCGKSGTLRGCTEVCRLPQVRDLIPARRAFAAGRVANGV